MAAPAPHLRFWANNSIVPPPASPSPKPQIQRSKAHRNNSGPTPIRLRSQPESTPLQRRRHPKPRPDHSCIGLTLQWIDFPTQLSYFKAMEKSLGQRLGDKETKKLLGRAVYLFSIGGNDYFSYATNNPNAPQIYKRQYVAMVIGNLTSVLKEIYNLGGRKIAFQNVGPLGCTPGTKAMNPALGGNCSEAHLTLARLHNRALFIAFKKFEKSLPGFKFSIFDYYNAAGDRISNPLKYGFKNGTSACCGSGPFRGSKCGTEPYELCSNPSEYVWFDGAHTTESANHQLAELIWNGPQNITGPYTVKELFELA